MKVKHFIFQVAVVIAGSQLSSLVRATVVVATDHNYLCTERQCGGTNITRHIDGIYKMWFTRFIISYRFGALTRACACAHATQLYHGSICYINSKLSVLAVLCLRKHQPLCPTPQPSSTTWLYLAARAEQFLQLDGRFRHSLNTASRVLCRFLCGVEHCLAHS